MSKFNISPEFEIAPYRNGVKLVHPSNCPPSTSEHLLVAEVNTLPCNTYLLDKKSECVVANEQMIESLGLSSLNVVLGKTVMEYLYDERCKRIIENDIKVLSSEMPLLADETRYENGLVHTEFLTIKMPAYDNELNLCGVFGFSITLGSQPLAESLSILSRMSLVNLAGLTKKIFLRDKFNEISGVNFTNRQAEVIGLLVRGLSACQVADKLGLSKRTVEHYIETIKLKLQVESKSQLIQKVIDEGYFG